MQNYEIYAVIVESFEQPVESFEQVLNSFEQSFEQARLDFGKNWDN